MGIAVMCRLEKFLDLGCVRGAAAKILRLYEVERSSAAQIRLTPPLSKISTLYVVGILIRRGHAQQRDE
ncbi:MAG: hypothetical protein ACRDHN_04790, partial [Thermomicrobiales bacterium]